MGSQADLLVLDRPPGPFDEHVVAHAPLPSMLMAISCFFRRPVKATLVNWLPWSELKIAGLPKRGSACSTASLQNAIAMAETFDQPAPEILEIHGSIEHLDLPRANGIQISNSIHQMDSARGFNSSNRLDIHHPRRRRRAENRLRRLNRCR